MLISAQIDNSLHGADIEGDQHEAKSYFSFIMERQCKTVGADKLEIKYVKEYFVWR